MNRLPDKPSALIRLALADLRKVEAQSDVYIVKMHMWHLAGADSAAQSGCAVCFAGAVMAKSLGVPPIHSGGPNSMFGDDTDTCKKLKALDHFRQGHVGMALERMGINPESFKIPYAVVADYVENRVQFHSDMEALASVLDGQGL